jgi:hypothetical protein
VTQHDGEFGATPHQAEFSPSPGHLCRVEQGPGNHGTFLGQVWIDYRPGFLAKAMVVGLVGP